MTSHNNILNNNNQLEKISLLVHVAKFACATPKQLCTFCGVTSTWNETIREYSVPKHNILFPIYERLAFNDNTESMIFATTSKLKEPTNEFPPVMNKFIKFAVRVISHLDPSSMWISGFHDDDGDEKANASIHSVPPRCHFFDFFCARVHQATHQMIKRGFYEAPENFDDACNRDLEMGGGYFGHKRQTILQLAASNKNHSTKMCRLICEYFYDEGKYKSWKENESPQKGKERLWNMICDPELNRYDFRVKRTQIRGLPVSPRPLEIAGQRGKVKTVEILLHFSSLLVKDAAKRNGTDPDSSSICRELLEGLLFSSASTPSSSSFSSAREIFQLVQNSKFELFFKAFAEVVQNRSNQVLTYNTALPLTMSPAWFGNDYLSNCCAAGNVELLRFLLHLPMPHCLQVWNEDENTRCSTAFEFNSFCKFVRVGYGLRSSDIALNCQDPPFIAAIRHNQETVIDYILEDYLPKLLQEDVQYHWEEYKTTRERRQFVASFLTDEYFVSAKLSPCFVENRNTYNHNHDNAQPQFVQYPALTFAVFLNLPEVVRKMLDFCQRNDIILSEATLKLDRKHFGPTGGNTALIVAIQQSSLELVDLLLHHPASPHFEKISQVNSSKNSPLHVAVKMFCRNINDNNNNCLHDAFSIVEKILQYVTHNDAIGINQDLTTPYDLLLKYIDRNKNFAENGKCQEMIQLFKKFKSDKSCINDFPNMEETIRLYVTSLLFVKHRFATLKRCVAENHAFVEMMRDPTKCRFGLYTSVASRVELSHLHACIYHMRTERVDAQLLLLCGNNDDDEKNASVGLSFYLTDSYQTPSEFHQTGKPSSPFVDYRNNTMLHSVAEFRSIRFLSFWEDLVNLFTTNSKAKNSDESGCCKLSQNQRNKKTKGHHLRTCLDVDACRDWVQQIRDLKSRKNNRGETASDIAKRKLNEVQLLATKDNPTLSFYSTVKSDCEKIFNFLATL